MAVICDDLKLLFICVPKTGSTSISRLLIDKFNGRWLPRAHVWDSSGTKIIVDYKHSTLRQLLQYNFLTSEQIQDLFKILRLLHSQEIHLIGLFPITFFGETVTRNIKEN